MTVLTRRTPNTCTPIDRLFQWINDEPFLQSMEMKPLEEGTLAVDVSESDGEVIVRASLPGFDKKDIDVQVHDGVLTIKAEHVQESEDSTERFYRRERRYGSLSRRIALPGVVSETNAKAELKDGVLTLRIPQSEAARPKKINIA